MKTADNYNFSGKRALIRVDFNVPLDKEGRITDDTRIRGALPAINRVLSTGGAVILMSHLGRPKGGYEEKYSLKHLVPHLSSLLSTPVQFADDCIGKSASVKAAALKGGDVLLLENLRFHKEEEKGDEVFAKKLASLGDVYVNDAFGTAHRAHASTTIVAKFFPDAKMFGYLMAAELKSIEKVLTGAARPFTAVTGGAKVSDKILIINRLLEKVDHLIIGGGMAYTFVKARGGKVGKSLVEEDKLDLARSIMESAAKQGVQLHLPMDSIIADNFSNDAHAKESPSDEIEEGWMGLDIGSGSRKKFSEVILQSKTILWNGPMGVFEMPKFETGTKAVAQAIAQATKNGAYSLIGGGDSAAAVNQFGFASQVSYVSTGGGALLEYIEGKILPGVKAVLEG